MATSTPPHNLGEVVDAMKAYMRNENITTKELMRYLKGPDFPTGGIVTNKDDLLQIYETGDSTDNGLASPHGELPLSQGGAVRIAVLGVRILGYRSQVRQKYRPLCHTLIGPRHHAF